MKLRIALALLIAAAAPAAAKERKIIEPLPAEIVAANHVVDVEVVVADGMVPKMAPFEAKAAEKRAAAGLPPIDAATPVAAGAPRPGRDEYSTLPFARMFPLVMQDVTRDWGLVGGRPVKLKVTVDNLKTANAAMAILTSSNDQLAGMVEVLDAATGAPLGAFYIDVLNGSYGLTGMALRGGGVREKLAEEFALQTSRVLTGRKKKKA